MRYALVVLVAVAAVLVSVADARAGFIKKKQETQSSLSIQSGTSGELSHVYRNFITVSSVMICPASSTTVPDALPEAKGRQFIHWIVGLLDHIGGMNAGRRLLDALQNTHRTVTIRPPCAEYKASDGPVTRYEGDQSSISVADRQRKIIAATLIPFKPRWELVDDSKAGNQVLLNSMRTATQNAGENLTPAQYAEQFKSAMDLRLIDVPEDQRMDVRYFQQLHNKLPEHQKAHVTAQELKEMAEGTKDIPNELYWALVSQLWKVMTPGAGTNAVVVMPFTPQGKPPKVVTEDYAPDWLMLTHELIHSWHFATGRRVVVIGWEEEANTVGLAPFEGAEFTENLFRQEAKLPPRTKYGHNTYSSCFARWKAGLVQASICPWN